MMRSMSIVEVLGAFIVDHFTGTTTVVTLALGVFVWRAIRKVMWVVTAGAVTLLVMLFVVRPSVAPHFEPSPPTTGAYR
jgi:hypothetical protein